VAIDIVEDLERDALRAWFIVFSFASAVCPVDALSTVNCA